MNVTGIGTDIVDIERIRAARHFERVAEYVLTPKEREAMHLSADTARFLASRFAAKEAVIKASSAPLSYRDIVIGKDGPKPRVQVRGNDRSFLVSIAHEERYAIANALESSTL